ncbi:branched-chain amino acid ABC transporter permease [Ammonifex thiophilus]|uniref:Branched-chain amino acid ABC transporter permease n=1 Tax=Ammonifex thiophilus TaxID=444093 RepID=A0A3D8P4W6_9THEO|nr:branched-chain amino acid ABC transporter permease [Ammonifex thiophilus]RDV83397.1 branched-chain amino acid ABC transporter permease [Ammonifex thiophilus]
MDPLFYLADTLIFIGIFSLLSLSLNLEFGLTSLGNFGKVAFFMAGAYAYTLLAHAALPPYLCFLGGALIAGLIGLVITLPALRLREDYLAIVTLSFGEILRTVVKAEEGLAGGVRGISVPAVFHLGSSRADALANILLTLGCLALCFLLLQALAHSPYGRVLRAIREDEVAVKALGKNPVYFKASVLFIGSCIAGLAGGIFAQYLNFIDPTMFLPTVTFLVWMMLILGGAGNNWGALLGGVVVELMNRGTRIMKDFITLPVDPNNLQFIFFGLLVILILIFRPQGILPEGPVKTAARKEAQNWISSL